MLMLLIIQKRNEKNILHDLASLKIIKKFRKIIFFIFVCIVDLITSLLKQCGLDLNFKNTKKIFFYF